MIYHYVNNNIAYRHIDINNIEIFYIVLYRRYIYIYSHWENTVSYFVDKYYRQIKVNNI